MTKAYCSSCGHGLANAHERPQATQGNLGQDITELVVGVSCSLPQLLKSGPPQSSPVIIMPACHDQPARCSNGVGQPSRADSAGWGCLVQLLSCTAQAEEDMLPAGMPGQAVEAISVQYKLAAAAVARDTFDRRRYFNALHRTGSTRPAPSGLQDQGQLPQSGASMQLHQK